MAGRGNTRWLLMVGLVACSSSPPSSDGGLPHCVVGQSSACACSDGQMGAQLCLANGTFGDCSCTGAPDSGPVDAGTDAGVDGGPGDAGPGLPVASPCSRNADCASLVCLPAGAAAGNSGTAYVCSEACGQSADCPSGWSCAPVIEVSTNLCLPPAVDAGSPSGGLYGLWLGQVSLVGGGDPAGTVATLAHSGFSASGTADGDGGFSIAGVPAGTYTLSLTKTMLLPADAGYGVLADGGSVPLTYQAVLPDLFFVPGGPGYIESLGALTPLVPIEAVAGAELVQGNGSYVAAPDAGQLYYLADAGLQTIAPGSQTPSTIAANATLPVFSPSGASIYYLASDGGTNLLFTAPLAGTPSTLLGAGVPDLSVGPNASLEFSPDGTQLFFLSSSGAETSLYRVPVDGGVPNDLGVIYPLNQGGNVLEFSPDGTYAVYQLFPARTLAVAPVVGGAATALGASLPLSIDSARFSSDSSHLAFLVDYVPSTARSELDVIQLPGGMISKIAPGVVDLTSANVALSPDGDQVAYVFQVGDGGEQAALSPSDGGLPTTNLGTQGIATMSFAPAGRFFAYIDGAYQLWTVAGPGANPIPIPGVPANEFVFSPDGTRLFADDGSTLTEVTLSTSTTQTLATNLLALPLFGRAVSFTADGQHALFATTGVDFYSFGVDEVTVATGAVTLLDSQVSDYSTFADGSMIEFSADGRYAFLFNGANGAALERVDLNAQTVTIIASGTSNVALSPDRSQLVYDQGDGTVSAAPAAAGPPVRLSNNGNFQGIFCANGARVALTTPGQQLNQLDLVSVGLDGGQPATLATNVNSYFVSPDGAHLGVYLPDPAYGPGFEIFAVVPASGGALLPINEFSSGGFAGSSVLTQRSGTPAPLGLQDGLYLTPLP